MIRTLVLSLQGAQVEELRSHKPCSVAKKKLKKQTKTKTKDVTGNLSRQREMLPGRNTIYNTQSTKKKKVLKMVNICGRYAFFLFFF